MLNFNLNQKVTLLVSSLIFSSLIGGALSYWGVGKLNESLDFISGPAWDAADGAMESTIGIQGQILAINKYMTLYAELNPDYASKQLESYQDGIEVMEDAYGRMKRSGLIDTSNIQLLDKLHQEFTSTETAVKESYKSYSQIQKRYSTLLSNFEGFMTELEEVGDGAVEFLETNPNKSVTWNSGLSERWGAADGGMESQIALLQMQYFLQEFMKTGGDSRFLEKFKSAQQDFSDLAMEIAVHPLFKSSYPNIPGISGSYAENVVKFERDFKQITADLIGKWQVFFNDQNNYNQASISFLDKLEETEELGDSKVENETAGLSDIQSLVYIAIFLAMILTLTISLVAAIGVKKLIVDPIVKMSKTLDDNQKDLTVRLEENDHDEIGMLAGAINRAYASKGKALSEIELGTYLVESQSLLLEHAAEVSSAGVKKQEQDTEQSATAIQQMSLGVKHLSENAQSASSRANQALDATEKGHNSVTATKKQIHELYNNISQMSDAILNLNKDTESISSVLDVIRGIAEQTNLLALNAAIEAARAGEQGRGFAVVADEVRTLASRTQESTQEIQATINNLVDSSKQVVSAMEQSSSQSQEAVSQIDETDRNLSAILEFVTEINQINSQIASTTEEQSVTSEQVADSLAKISSASKDTLNAVSSVSMASGGLTKISDNLNQQINKFKI